VEVSLSVVAFELPGHGARRKSPPSLRRGWGTRLLPFYHLVVKSNSGILPVCRCCAMGKAKRKGRPPVQTFSYDPFGNINKTGSMSFQAGGAAFVSEVWVPHPFAFQRVRVSPRAVPVSRPDQFSAIPPPPECAQRGFAPGQRCSD